MRREQVRVCFALLAPVAGGLTWLATMMTLDTAGVITSGGWAVPLSFAAAAAAALAWVRYGWTLTADREVERRDICRSGFVLATPAVVFGAGMCSWVATFFMGGTEPWGDSDGWVQPSWVMPFQFAVMLVSVALWGAVGARKARGPKPPTSAATRDA